MRRNNKSKEKPTHIGVQVREQQANLLQDEALCHGLGEVLVVLQGLHDRGLRSGAVAVMLDRKTDDFVDFQLDGLGLHVLFILGDMICRSSETPAIP